MDVGSVELLLEELHEAVDLAEGRSRGGSIVELDSTVQSLCSALSRCASDAEFGAEDAQENMRRVCATLFDGGRSTPERRDLLGYLKRSVTIPGTSKVVVHKAREQLCNVIANFIPLAGTVLQPYMADIRQACLSLIKFEKASESAKSALGPLSQIMLNKLMTEETFRPLEVWDTLLDALRSTASVFHKQDGPKGAAMALLGMLVASFPHLFTATQVRMPPLQCCTHTTQRCAPL